MSNTLVFGTVVVFINGRGYRYIRCDRAKAAEYIRCLKKRLPVNPALRGHQVAVEWWPDGERGKALARMPRFGQTVC